MSESTTMTMAPTGPSEHSKPNPPRLRVALIVVGLVLVPVSAVAGYVGGVAVSAFGTAFIAAPAAVIVVVTIWHHPAFGLYLLFGAAVLIEQFPVYVSDSTSGPLTALLPAYQAIAPGVIVSPAEVLAGLTLGTVVLQALRDRRRPVPRRSATLRMLTVVLILAGLYVIVGVSRGGDLTRALWEVRPYFYLAVTFIIASLLITSMRQARPLLWILVLGAGVKALYGMVIWFSTRSLQPRPEAVLAHEESFFFGVFVFLVVALWLFKVPGTLRTVATLLLPMVLLADLVNSRRTAWLILGLGILVLIMITYKRRPERRPALIAGALLIAIGSAVYLPLYWDGQGALSQPARALRSQVDPTPRDESSNNYREIENENLYEYIRAQSTLGMGFGLPLTYEGIPDLSDTNELISYVPHNNVLHVWLRTGLLGITLWITVIALALSHTVRLAHRSPDTFVAAFAATVAAALLGYAAMGLVDLGFFWFRMAFAMGILLGAAHGLSREVRR